MRCSPFSYSILILTRLGSATSLSIKNLPNDVDFGMRCGSDLGAASGAAIGTFIGLAETQKYGEATKGGVATLAGFMGRVVGNYFGGAVNGAVKNIFQENPHSTPAEGFHCDRGLTALSKMSTTSTTTASPSATPTKDETKGKDGKDGKDGKGGKGGNDSGSTPGIAEAATTAPANAISASATATGTPTKTATTPPNNTPSPTEGTSTPSKETVMVTVTATPTSTPSKATTTPSEDVVTLTKGAGKYVTTEIKHDEKGEGDEKKKQTEGKKGEAVSADGAQPDSSSADDQMETITETTHTVITKETVGGQAVPQRPKGAKDDTQKEPPKSIQP